MIIKIGYSRDHIRPGSSHGTDHSGAQNEECWAEVIKEIKLTLILKV